MPNLGKHLDGWGKSFGQALDRFNQPDQALSVYEKLGEQDFADLTALFGSEWTASYVREMEHKRLQQKQRSRR